MGILNWRTMPADKSNSSVKTYTLPKDEIDRIFADVKPGKKPVKYFFEEALVEYNLMPGIRRRKRNAEDMEGSK